MSSRDTTLTSPAPVPYGTPDSVHQAPVNTRARARSLVALDAGSDALDAWRPAAHLLAALAEQLVAIVRYLGRGETQRTAPMPTAEGGRRWEGSNGAHIVKPSKKTRSGKRVVRRAADPEHQLRSRDSIDAPLSEAATGAA